MAQPWSIELKNLGLGGFAPAWYKETYPSYGNKNQAGAMVNIDLTNAGYLTQGPGLANLTNGTQAAAVTTLIKGILGTPAASDATYAVGGAKLYKLSSTTVTNDATWPHTIDKAAVTGEDGEDVALFQGALYYSYNHSGSAGDIGKYDLASTFDDDWGSTVPTSAAALTSNPHPMCVGGNGTLAIGNGRYLAVFDGTELDTQALDLPTGFVVVDVAWSKDRWFVTANLNNVSGSNKNQSSVFIWDGTALSWEMEIPLMGKAGASHVKNGTVLQWYQDITSTGGYKVGVIDGGSVSDLANYTGALPAFYQTADYKDFVLWDSAGLTYAIGSGDKDLPVRLFQMADGGYATVGGMAVPFGTPIVASTESTNYKLAQYSGYDVTSSWKSLMFDLTGKGRNSTIEAIRINFETLASGARVDWSLVNNQGKTIISDTISYAKQGAVTTYWNNLNKGAENCRVELNYANGSATNPVKIKSIKIYGYTE